MTGLSPLMTPKIRALMLKVLHGNPMETPFSAIPPFLFRILKHPQCEEILTGLVERKIVGKEFLHWFVFIHRESLAAAAKDILSKRVYRKTVFGITSIN